MRLCKITQKSADLVCQCSDLIRCDTSTTHSDSEPRLDQGERDPTTLQKLTILFSQALLFPFARQRMTAPIPDKNKSCGTVPRTRRTPRFRHFSGTEALFGQLKLTPETERLTLLWGKKVRLAELYGTKHVRIHRVPVRPV